MAFENTKRFMDLCREKKLRYSDVMVLSVICEDADTGVAFSGSNKLMCEETGYSSGSIRNAFNRLEHAGLITRSTTMSRDSGNGRFLMEREVFLTDIVLDAIGLKRFVASGGGGNATGQAKIATGEAKSGGNWGVFCTSEHQKWDEPLPAPRLSPLPFPLPSSASPHLSTNSPPYIPPHAPPLTPSPVSGPMKFFSGAGLSEPMELVGGCGGNPAPAPALAQAPGKTYDTRRLMEAMERLKHAQPSYSPENDPLFAKVSRENEFLTPRLTPDSRNPKLHSEVNHGYSKSGFPAPRSRDRESQESGRATGEIKSLFG